MSGSCIGLPQVSSELFYSGVKHLSLTLSPRTATLAAPQPAQPLRDIDDSWA